MLYKYKMVLLNLVEENILWESVKHNAVFMIRLHIGFRDVRTNVKKSSNLFAHRDDNALSLYPLKKSTSRKSFFRAKHIIQIYIA